MSEEKVEIWGPGNELDASEAAVLDLKPGSYRQTQSLIAAAPYY
jgi:hypothetical protein